MRTLSAALLTELGLSVTRPGFLVSLGFSTTLYLSTMGFIAWNGQSWAVANIRISGISQDGSGVARAQIDLGNTDNAYGALVLNEGASEIPVSVWACYAGATAAGDPVQVFSGVTDGADIDERSVKLAVVSQSNSTLFSPRVFVNRAAGFNFLQPVGTKIFANGQTFVLERASG